MANVPYLFANQAGPIPLSELDADFAAFNGSTGASYVGYNQGSTGAVNNTVADELQFLYNVKNFGAKGDGVTDDTTAIQTAINSCPGRLFFPSGVYLCGQVTISREIFIYGEGGRSGGSTGTLILANSATTNVFLVDTSYGVTIQDLCIQGNGATSGSGILVQDTGASGTANLFTRIVNVHFEQLYYGAYFAAASSWVVDGCQFWNIKNIGLTVDNTYNKDQGDQSIINCTFLGPSGTTGVVWQGGGGTRIVNNKFLMTRGVLANFNNTTANPTGQFLVSNNSFDMNTSETAGSGIQLFINGGTLNFDQVIIVGNLFTAYAAVQAAINISGYPSGSINHLMISGNEITNTSAAFALGHIFMDYCNNFSVGPNFMIGSGSGTGISIGSHCTNGSVIFNEIENVTTQVSNGSPGVRVRGVSNSGQTASVSDGGTITHNLGVTPTKVIISGLNSAQFYTPNSFTSTTFAVAIKNTTGGAGIASTICWQVEA